MQVFGGLVCPILTLIFAVANGGLVIWSTILSGKQACSCCRDGQVRKKHLLVPQFLSIPFSHIEVEMVWLQTKMLKTFITFKGREQRV